MSRQFPIWFDVTNCNYKSSKSFGGRNTIKQKVLVGSSSNNSNHFCDFITTRRRCIWKGQTVWVFKVSLDEVVLKVQIYSNEKDRPGDLIKEYSKMENIKSIKVKDLERDFDWNTY